MIETKKEVEFIKKKPNEEVNVTYDLNGGLYDGSSNNILYNIAKGSKIAEDKIPDSAKLQKDNMVFEYWMIDNNYAEPLGYLLKKNVVFIAKWTSKPAKGTDLRDYIKDAKITKGSQDDYFKKARSIKNSYDKDKDGAPNKKTIFSIDTDFSNNEAEVVYEFKHLVEIEKINVALMGTAVATQKYNNLRKMEVYGSTDNNNWEKIGELDNPDGDNEKDNFNK